MTVLYGFCPTCNAPGVTRERSPAGSTTCENGHHHSHSKFTTDPKPTSMQEFIALMQHNNQDVNQLTGGVFANPSTREKWDIWCKALEFANK